MLSLFKNKTIGVLVLDTLILVAISVFLYADYTSGMDAKSPVQAIKVILSLIWPLILIWIIAIISLVHHQ